MPSTPPDRLSSPPPPARRSSPPPPPPPPPASPPPVTPTTNCDDEAVVPSSTTTNPFLQPLGSLFPSSPSPAPNNGPLLSNGSTPFSGSVSPTPPPAPQSPEPQLSNEQILSMIRPLLRVLQRRRMLDCAPPDSSSLPNFPEPKMHDTTGTGTSGVPYSFTTLHDVMGSERFASITMKTALQNKSLEELRLEDYNLAKTNHPLSAAQEPSLPQSNDQSSAKTPPCSKKVSFRDPPLLCNPALSNFAAANGFGPAANLFKLPLLPLATSNTAPSSNLHPISSPFSFPSSSQPAFQQPNAPQTFAKSNNSNTYATNWLSSDKTQKGPTLFKPHNSQSTFANSSNSFSFPSAPQSAPNGIASSFGPPPVHNSFASTSPFIAKGGGNDNGAATSHDVGKHTSNLFGATGFTQNVTQRQTFTMAAGENHGPVFNEICVSQTAIFPRGWFW
ncbi:Proline rich extensin [Gracilaria domingensis]|nr:Proline rich extensin [Gracilaria domingensis]